MGVEDPWNNYDYTYSNSFLLYWGFDRNEED